MERVLKEGFCGIEAQAAQLRDACDLSDPDGVDKILFYDAVIMVCQAVRDFALRYHRLALEKAETAEAERRNELLEIARICKKVPYEAPSTYHEAIQTVFFLQLLPQIESDGTGISAGRLDMFRYPFYSNVVSSDTLRDAQKHPEQYRDLVVRVAGYTAFFTDLNKDIQNDIIDRTEMDFAL